jgi:hypothetical protein
MSVVRWAGISSQFVPTDIIFEKSVKKSTSFQNEKDRTRKTKRQKDKKTKRKKYTYLVRPGLAPCSPLKCFRPTLRLLEGQVDFVDAVVVLKQPPRHHVVVPVVDG